MSNVHRQLGIMKANVGELFLKVMTDDRMDLPTRPAWQVEIGKKKAPTWDELTGFMEVRAHILISTDTFVPVYIQAKMDACQDYNRHFRSTGTEIMLTSHGQVN